MGKYLFDVFCSDMVIIILTSFVQTLNIFVFIFTLKAGTLLIITKENQPKNI